MSNNVIDNPFLFYSEKALVNAEWYTSFDLETLLKDMQKKEEIPAPVLKEMQREVYHLKEQMAQIKQALKIRQEKDKVHDKNSG